MKIGFLKPLRLLGFGLLAALAPLSSTVFTPIAAQAQEAVKDGGVLRVGLLADQANYDPQQFSTVNFHLIKNLYDSLIEYSPEGEAIPNLATEWTINEDNTSITLKLRDDAVFPDGSTLTSADVVAALEKGANADTGKNLFATMAIVKDWEAPDPQTITVNFNNPVPTKQITDLLQFVIPIQASKIADVENVPAGTGPFLLGDRVVGQSLTLKKNPNYWREGEPKLDEIQFTVFSDDAAASAALESGSIDMVYNSTARNAARLEGAGFQVVRGPGPLVQVFRINATRPPFDNADFRKAFNYLMDRDGMIRVAYAGLGTPTALPWADASPAFDASYTTEYAYNLDKAKELLASSGLTPEQQSDWSMLVFGNDEAVGVISQIVQASLAEVGINIQLDVRQGAEYTDALLAGDFDATFGAVGNAQKSPSRIATNSIYRIAKNPVLKDPHPFPAYVDAITKINTTPGPEDAVAAAYAELNKVLIESSFAIPTNTVDTGLIVAAPTVGGWTMDIDNLLIGRTIGFK